MSEIKSVRGRLIYHNDGLSIKECVIHCIEDGVSLSYADLRGADLSYVNLSYANLSRAYLRGADLRGVNLRDTNLTGTCF